MRIGHGVVLLPFPYNHPVRVAERIATLDILSNGRVEMGTGRSITVQELGGFGIPPKETRARWEEALDIITTIWRSPDGTFSYKGDYFDIPERTVVPMPVQKPHPPIWTACTSEDTHRLAGEKGLGLLSFTVLVRPEKLGQRVAMYRDALTGPSRWGSSSTARPEPSGWCTAPTPTPRPRRRPSGRSCPTSARPWRSARRCWKPAAPGRSAAEIAADPNREVTEYEGLDPRKVDLQYMIDNGMCIVGSPDTVIRQLERIQAAANLDLFLRHDAVLVDPPREDHARHRPVRPLRHPPLQDH